MGRGGGGGCDSVKDRNLHVQLLSCACRIHDLATPLPSVVGAPAAAAAPLAPTAPMHAPQAGAAAADASAPLVQIGHGAAAPEEPHLLYCGWMSKKAGSGFNLLIGVRGCVCYFSFFFFHK